MSGKIRWQVENGRAVVLGAFGTLDEARRFAVRCAARQNEALRITKVFAAEVGWVHPPIDLAKMAEGILTAGVGQ